MNETRVTSAALGKVRYLAQGVSRESRSARIGEPRQGRQHPSV